MEIWKDINGYNGLYQVSNNGNVKSLERMCRQFNGHCYCNRKVTEKILKGRKDTKGYLQVELSKNGKQRKYLVHKLVAMMFIPNPHNKPQINHINGRKNDNRVDNLEWVTPSENVIHAYKTGLLNIDDIVKHCRKLGEKSAKKVNQYNLQGEYVKTWDSISEAHRSLKVDCSSISRCCRNKQQSAGGYKWAYFSI